MIPLLCALFILCIFFFIESKLRFSEEAKSWKASAADKNTTLNIRRIFGINFLCLALSFLFIYFNLFILFKDNNYAFIGSGVMLTGLAFRVAAVKTLRQYYTRTLKVSSDQKIINTGLYKYVRHPGYLGVLMVWVGAGISSDNYLALSIITVLNVSVYHFRMNAEEEMLNSAFGDEYTNYKKRTFRLIPFVY
jgi:protein-S-isoprenylcysteine O-methyltransferase Ste14